jgi:MFS family permease
MASAMAQAAAPPPLPLASRARESLKNIAINREYSLFMAGSFFSASGMWIQSVAIGWLVLELGNSAFLLGLAGFARMVPLLFASFPAGLLADRCDRRQMLLLAHCGLVVATVPLAVTAWLGVASIPLIIALALLSGVFDAFAWPVWTVFIKDLVGPEHLRTAVAVNSTRFNLTRIVGPAIGGILLARWGAPLCFAVSLLGFLALIGALLLVDCRVRGWPDRTPWLPALREGLSYSWGELPVRRLLLISAAFGLFGMPYQHLLPAVARDSLGLGPEGLGLLMSAVGVGAIAGAILSGTRLVARSTPYLLIGLPVGLGMGLIVLGLVDVVPVAGVALGAVGLYSVAHMAIANATLQLVVRDDMVGRVMGLWTVLQGGMMPVGSLLLGAVADVTSLGAALVAAGLGVAAVPLMVGARSGFRLETPTEQPSGARSG